MTQTHWKALLTEPAEKLEEKYNNSSKKMSFLSYCLKAGFLIEEKYFSWAKAHYEIPKVNSRFFEENTPKMTLWKKWKDFYPWSSEIIPLGEWDGHLFVGALEPKPEIQKKAKVQFLLCSPTDLEDWWKIYHPVSLEKAAEQIQSQAPKSLFILDHWKKTNSKAVVEISQYVFSHMKPLFDKTMILSLNDKLNLLRPFTWDEGFKEHSQNLKVIPLQTPSIFNIVTSTQKPYHGHVTPNEINDSFFESWNQGKNPEHATITPILLNDNIVGMILGIGPKTLYTKQTLQKVESLATEVAKKLEITRKSQAQAA